MFDAIKNYLALANGVSEVTRQRALAAAKGLVASGEATAEQVTNLADDLLTTSRNNRDTVLALIRYEVDRAMVRLGLATSEEFTALAQRLSAVEAAVRDAATLPEPTPADASASPAPTPPPRPVTPTPPTGAPGRPTKRATKAARKAPSKRSPAKRSPAKRVAGGTSAGASSATASPRETPLPPAAPAVRKAATKAPGKKASAAKKAPAASKSAPAKKAPRAKKALPPDVPPATAGDDA